MVDRAEIRYKNEDVPINPGMNIKIRPQEIQDYFHHHVLLSNAELNREYWYSYILGLQSFLKLHKIKYIFSNTISWLTKDDIFSNIINQIDISNYYEPFDWKKSMIIQLKDLNLSTQPPANFHYMEDGHQVWADILYSFIQQNNILEKK